MMQRLRMIRSFFTDSKYSADHGPLPHISVGHVCKQTLHEVCKIISQRIVRIIENLTKNWGLNNTI